jgi:alpha-galactosidase/6-phospho-beta-glucosidase family protein
VLNNGALASFPDSAMLQMTCQLGYEKLKRPKIRKLPEFIQGVLASRILQNDLAARALANQDEKLMLQAMLMLPDRVSVSDAVSTVRMNLDVEPAIPVN